MTREDDIQELCKQVIENTCTDYDYNNGNYSCPFCGGDGYDNEISNIQHDGNCAYLIAKDLTTNNN